MTPEAAGGDSRRLVAPFFLLSCAALARTVFENLEEFSRQDVVSIYVYCAAVIALQIMLVLAAGRLGRRVAAGVAGIFTALNIYTLIFVHSDRVAGLDFPAMAGIILALSLAFSVAYAVPNAAFRKFMCVFPLVMLVLTGGHFLIVKAKEEPPWSLPDHFTVPQFTRHPNVYVITFDAISPEAVLKENFDIPGVAYDEIVTESNGRIIPNSFADRISTKPSLNSFLAMDLDYFDRLKKKNVMVTDRVENPVYKIFRRNGYKIQFVYESAYFGQDSGRLDYYGIARESGICTHVEKPYALMGYCLEGVRNAVRSMLRIEDHEYPRFLFDRIKAVSKSGEPWYTQAHIYRPGHVANSFDPRKEKIRAEGRQRHIERTAEAEQILRDLLQVLKENDPDAVLIIFGDHGALVSWNLIRGRKGLAQNALTIRPEALPADSPLSFTQLVQDRHAVFLAVFPKDFCQEGFTQNPYSTVRIMRDVVKCLSGGQDPLPADFQPDDDRWKPYVYQ